MNYAALTDDELLVAVDTRRQHSPIIDQLARRLTSALDQRFHVENFTTMPCPVCDASLDVAPDEGMISASLKVAQ